VHLAWRHLIENGFAKLKESRTVATRYDKTHTRSLQQQPAMRSVCEKARQPERPCKRRIGGYCVAWFGLPVWLV
jgi:hypothetical protein